jgi:type I restriction enzyme S subunit
MELDSLNLPDDWQIRPIREVYAFTTKPRGLSIHGITPFLPMDDLPIGHLHVSDFEERLASALTSGTYIENGDLLVAKITPSFENGKQAIVAWKQHPFGFATTEVIPIQEVRDVSDKVFLFFLLLHPEIRSDLAGKMEGTTGRQRLSKAVLGNRLIPFPPLAEQQKIGGVLRVVQRAMEQQEQLLELTTELKRALLHQLFTKGLRGEPSQQTDVGPVPQSWQQRPLEEAGEVVYGIQAAVASNLKPIGTKILTNKNITLDGRITLESINYFVLKTKRHHETVLKKGDLLFNWRSGSKEHVGKTAYFDLDGEFTHSSFILRIRPKDEVTGRYLFYYLMFLRESGYFLKSQTFSINAKFNKSAVNRLPTYLPAEDEQREIVAALDAVAKRFDVVQAKRRILDDLFRTLLHQLMTAKIRVNHLDLAGLGVGTNGAS